MTEPRFRHRMVCAMTGYEERWSPVPLPCMADRPLLVRIGSLAIWFDGAIIRFGFLARLSCLSTSRSAAWARSRAA